jgi:hypothetical protein
VSHLVENAGTPKTEGGRRHEEDAPSFWAAPVIMFLM